MDKMDRMDKSESLIPKHGGYRKLKSFQVAEVIYDLTVRFCNRYIDRRSRTHDQMVQAARSGRQNIAEGSVASATSKKIEMKLTGIAKASLQELLLDYEDYLRQNNLNKWEQFDPRRSELIAGRPASADDVADWARRVRKSTTSIQSIPSISYDEIAANGALALITVTCSLLDRQMKSQAKAFEKDGGFTEKLYRRRSASRSRPR